MCISHLSHNINQTLDVSVITSAEKGFSKHIVKGKSELSQNANVIQIPVWKLYHIFRFRFINE